MTNFNCACPAIQRGQGSGFLSEGSSWLTACMSEQRRFWRDCAHAQARLNLRSSSEGSGATARMHRLAWTFAARIDDKYQIRLTRSEYWRTDPGQRRWKRFSTSFHYNPYNLTMFWEELYKYLCFRSYPIICINSFFVCCILKYEINMFKPNILGGNMRLSQSTWQN